MEFRYEPQLQEYIRKHNKKTIVVEMVEVSSCRHTNAGTVFDQEALPQRSHRIWRSSPSSLPSGIC